MLKVNVHIRDEMYVVYCGNGSQRIRWLADVAIHRYNHFNSADVGVAKGVRFDNGTNLVMDDIINEHLNDDSHVWVVLKGTIFFAMRIEDLALMEEEPETKSPFDYKMGGVKEDKKMKK